MKSAAMIRRALVSIGFFLVTQIGTWASAELPSIAAKATGSIIYVTTVEDELQIDGDCSLREAIYAANTDQAYDACAAGRGYDVVVVPAGSYVLKHEGANEESGLTGDLDLTSDLAIQGSGCGETIIDGYGLDRVFHVHDSSYVVLYNMSIVGGIAAVSADSDGAAGGAVLNEGSLLISDCELSGNLAADGAEAINGRTAGQGGNGGAIANRGYVMVFYSDISENIAGRGGISLYDEGGQGGHGGGIFNDLTGQAYLYGTTVRNNRSGAGGVGISLQGASGSGGGVASLGSMEIVSSRIVDNRTSKSGSTAWGGGLFSSGDVTMSDSEMNGNWSLDGGAIYMSGMSVFKNVTISGNTANLSGGGLFAAQDSHATLTQCTVAKNVAGSSPYGGGGGLMVDRGDVIVRRTLFAENEDYSGSFVQSPNISGVIECDGPNLYDDQSGFSFSGSLSEQIFVADAGLNALTFNGGLTQTHGLRSDSPALNKVDYATIETTSDQRGADRPERQTLQGDLGAFEYTQDIEIVMEHEESSWQKSESSLAAVAINVMNDGFGVMNDVAVEMTIPEGLSVVQASQTHGSCTISGQSILCPMAKNEVVNGDAAALNFDGWFLKEASTWQISSEGYDDASAFMITLNKNARSQEIDLLEQGYTVDYLDSAPAITVSEHVRSSNGSAQDGVFMRVQLLDENRSVVDEWSYGLSGKFVPVSTDWQELSHVFEDYASGVRYITILEGGLSGNQDPLTSSGPLFDSCSVRLSGSRLTVSEQPHVTLIVTGDSASYQAGIMTTATDDDGNVHEVSALVTLTIAEYASRGSSSELAATSKKN